MRIIRPSISSMTASVIGFERSSSTRSRQAASQRSIHGRVTTEDRGPPRRRALIGPTIDHAGPRLYTEKKLGSGCQEAGVSAATIEAVASANAQPSSIDIACPSSYRAVYVAVLRRVSVRAGQRA